MSFIPDQLISLYKLNNIPDSNQIKLPKNIVLTVPDKSYDVSGTLIALGLSKWEVNVIYPKSEKFSPLDEAISIEPKLIIQLGKEYSSEFAYVPSGGLPDSGLRELALKATGDRFVPLHHHDEYSLQDGLGTCHMLADLLTAQRRSFMAITNHGSIGGWIKQHNICKQTGIKAIYGCEIYTNNYRGNDPDEKKKNRSANHMIVLARTKEGYDNIIKLHNDAQLNGYYYSPRVDDAHLKMWGSGIISSSSCFAGRVCRLLMEDKYQEAEDTYAFYASCFDKFFIELQIIEFDQQRELNRRLIGLAKKVNAPMVCAVDSHYCDPAHADTHSLLMYIRQKKIRGLEERPIDEDVWDFEVKNLYNKNADQLEELYRSGWIGKKGDVNPPFLDDVFTEDVFYQAMANTRNIAIETEEIKLDSTIKLPKLYPDSKAILRQKANEGFKRLGLHLKPNSKEYAERLKYEYEVITKAKFEDYFLVAEKFVKFSKDSFGEWSISLGRGSGAGSLLAWCLDLTGIDPIENHLYFERFIDESRAPQYVCSFEV